MNFKNFLNIPEVEKEGIIKKIEINRNPILIKIDDGTIEGTEIFLSPSELRRYLKTSRLELNSKIKVYFQKNPTDRRKTTFQISRVVFL